MAHNRPPLAHVGSSGAPYLPSLADAGSSSRPSCNSQTESLPSTSSIARPTFCRGSRTVHFELVPHPLADRHDVMKGCPSIARITSSALI